MLKDKNFMNLMKARLLSNFGGAITSTIMAWLIIQVTDSSIFFRSLFSNFIFFKVKKYRILY